MPKQRRSDDWGFPRWRSYGDKGRAAAKVRLCDREGCNEVGDRPEDVELELAVGGVADAYRPGAGVAGQGVDDRLGAEVVAVAVVGREIAILAPLVVLVLVLGFYPKPVLDTVTPTVQQTLSAVQGGK